MVSLVRFSILIISTLVSATLNNTQSSSSFKDSNGAWEFLGVSGYSGYITMNALTGSSLFFWLFEAINSNITEDTKPLIIWLEGGPGCSGTFTMLWQTVSPIQVNYNTQPLRTNTNHTWATSYHIMSIDFPYNVGYSFANSDSDQKNSTQASTYYLYRFLYKLWQKYPVWFSNRDIFIFGYSYGGHWVPGLAWNILQQNELNNGFNFPLKGIAIGNPWVDPATQSQTYSSFAFTNSLINTNQMSIVNYYQNLVTTYLNTGQLFQAQSSWENILDTVVSFAGGVDIYNVRNYGAQGDYSDTNLAAFMSKSSTRSLLHVGSKQWIDCNRTVFEYYTQDIMNSTISYFPSILSKGIQVMIYNGQNDFICNTPGVENMIASIDWPGASGFASAPKLNWMVEGSMAGYVQTYQNLTFVLILNAGHLAQYDQPVYTKNMAERFVNGTGWS